jgi:serine/threonine-protein kinase HipA
MSVSAVDHVQVGLDFGGGAVPLGRLALRNRQIFFEYDPGFLTRDLNVSPFRLPLKPGVQTFERRLFGGLPGLFNDSLPDGWGRLLFDRAMRAKGFLPEQFGPLDRLAHVGQTGMGALTYKPDHSETPRSDPINLDWLAAQSADVLAGEADDVLAELLALNGSSAGARPKALIGYNRQQDLIIHSAGILDVGHEPWIVKFANIQDGPDAGAIEFVYAEMARWAGLDVPETHLFSAKQGAGYFATKRFDRAGSERVHMHTACGLLHSDFRTPSLDYQDLIELTTLLTRDVRETEKMFRLAVFNVMAHNRDDHSKNFSYLMNEIGEWRLSPAYDLTFSSGPGGEQSTMVMGEGKALGIEHLRALGQIAGLSMQTVNQTIERTQMALSAWQALANKHSVGKANIKLIGDRLKAIRN